MHGSHHCINHGCTVFIFLSLHWSKNRSPSLLVTLSVLIFFFLSVSSFTFSCISHIFFLFSRFSISAHLSLYYFSLALLHSTLILLSSLSRSALPTFMFLLAFIVFRISSVIHSFFFFRSILDTVAANACLIPPFRQHHCLSIISVWFILWSGSSLNNMSYQFFTSIAYWACISSFFQ